MRRIIRAIGLALAATGIVSASAAGAPAEELDDAFARARRLADERRYEAACEISQELVTRAPESYDYGLFHARCLGWADRNAASADAYERLVALHPDAMPAIGPEWAKQLLWAERHREAIGLYDRLLGESPESRELLEGRALALSWTGDADGAVRAYRRLLEQYPDSDTYRHRYAQNLVWAGREGRAERVLRAVPPAERTPEETRLLDAIVARALRPWARALYAHSTDSDDLEIENLEVQAGTGLTSHLWIGGSLARDRFEADARTIEIDRFGAIVRLRAGDVAASLHARVGDADEVDFSPLTGTAAVSWRLADLVELSVDGERTDYESIRALEREVIGTFVSAGVRLHPGGRLDMSGAAGAGVIDGPGEVVRNERLHASAEAGVLAMRRPRLRTFTSVYAFSFSERTADGYWNPDEYWTWVAGVDVNPSFPALRLDLVFAGTLGVQKETPGETSSTGSLVLRAIVRPVHGLSVEYRFDRSDSAVDSDRGFDRTRHSVIVGGSF